MSDASELQRDDAVQAKFDAQAPHLGFELELADAVRLESRTVGILLLAHQEGEIEVAIKPSVQADAVGPSDDDQIRSVIEGWEGLHPEDIPDRYGEFTTHPFAGVGEFLAFVSPQRIQAFLSSDRYQHEIEPTMHRPRRIKIYQLNITYLGRHKAVATYQVEEEHPSGSNTVVTSAAILAKPNGAWKLAVITK